MANRRMFSIEELQSDRFLSLTATAQALYIQICLSADDDGFTARIKLTERLIGATDKEFQELINAGYLIKFESGVCVVANWLVNNQIRKDRYHETSYKAEKSSLVINGNQWYTKRQPNSDQMATNGLLSAVEFSAGQSSGVQISGVEGSAVEVSPGQFNPPPALPASSSTAIKQKDIINSHPKSQQNSEPLVSEEVIRSALTRNGNNVNSLVNEIIDSVGSNIDQPTMQLIGKISKEIRGQKNE